MLSLTPVHTRLCDSNHLSQYCCRMVSKSSDADHDNCVVDVIPEPGRVDARELAADDVAVDVVSVDAGKLVPAPDHGVNVQVALGQQLKETRFEIVIC
jgi:hypothetical protein